MALLLSSHVAASMVGGSMSRAVFNLFGIDTMLVPTVNYGRHPGWGPPGGGKTEAEAFSSMIDAIGEQGMFSLTDIVLTGYFGDAGQVSIAADTIDRVRRAGRQHDGARAFADHVSVVVDPVLGDAPGGLYVDPSVAAAIRDQLVSRADLVTPNLFELGYLTGRSLTDLASMVRAARALERPVLVSSLPRHGQIGVMYVDSREAWIVTHDRSPDAPKGTGDLLTAAFATSMLRGASAREALEFATAATVSVVMRANQWNSPEMPVVAAASVLQKPLITFQAQPI
ncbi:PfkB family carbohydrate kinase [Maricaulis salignorans]|uniref:pyridoxal kinase n=1 Tax=Maricaulis salignorans TaxID=144026 RepID=A0A1G9LDX4_9PROT|nr:PfkB family carbohydrate kinase [Maricaulis salignorans]SDL59973.1 Pyridoxal kinase [Maricaulis salignorans]